jgi:predicted phosphoribosyltransferase
MNYRLHIDVPLVADMNESIAMSNKIVELLQKCLNESDLESVRVNYRLGNDEDRTNKNYLVLTDNGHATKNKSYFEIRFNNVE